MEQRNILLVVAKIVDDMTDLGNNDHAKTVLEKFKDNLKIGTLRNGPGDMRFFGINTVQNDDLTIVKKWNTLINMY